MPYATEADLVPAYLPAAPAQVDLLLARASRDIDRALLTAVYPVDEQGLPTEAAHIAALKEATCEQVAAWAAVGETGTGATAEYTTVSIGSVTLGRGQSGGSSDRGSAATRLSQQAWNVLQQAGLTGGEPYTYRPCAVSP